MNTVAEAARAYIRKGWPVLPCDGKKPTVKEWTKIKIPFEEVDQYFRKGINVGVRLENFTDIDLDCHEAILLAKIFLPPTKAIFGHGVKAESHRLYDCHKIKAEKYTYNNKVLLEIRHGSGFQTVMPGSVHVSGEKITWVNGWTPITPLTKIKADELKAHCDKLAAATILAQHWKEGVRDDLAVAVYGILIRGGVEPIEADDFILGVAVAAGDDQDRVKGLYQAKRLRHGDKVPGIPRLKEIIGEEGKDKFLEWMRLDTGLNVIEELNKQHAFTVLGGKDRVLVFDSNGILKDHNSVVAMERMYMNKPVKVHGKEINPFILWMNHKDRREYKGLIFDPSGGKHVGMLNLWQGYTVEPSYGPVERYLEHVYGVVCSGNTEKYEWVLAWLADMVQNPVERPGTALVLRGGEGVGKGMFMRPWQEIYGEHSVTIFNSKQLTGQFNWVLKDKMLVVADEVIWGGDKREAGALRGLITEPKIMIEPKGVNAFSMPAYFRLVMLTNSIWAVPAAMDSRRFCVLDVSGKMRGNRGYWEALLQVKPESILHYFMTYKSRKKIDLREALWTEELQTQRELSMHPIHQWYYQKLREGAMISGYSWSDPIPSYRLKAAVSAINSRITETEVGIYIRRACPTVGKKQITRNGERQWYYQFPSLENCRELFEINVCGGGKIEW